jgi:hypothetical protein
MPTYPSSFREAVQELDGLNYQQRAARRKDFAKRYAVTPATIGRWLVEAGVRDRKRRVDRGVKRGTDVSIYLKILALRKQSEKRQTGMLMTIESAIEILQHNGDIPAGVTVSASSYSYWERERGISWRLREVEPHVEMRSKGPNHVHQADFSLAVNWKIENNRAVYEHEIYKNKLPDKGTPRLMRFVLADHSTGMFFVWYAAAAGETTELLIDGLFRAWDEKKVDGRSVQSLYPMRGVPEILMLDRGPGTKTTHLKNFLAAFDVKLLVCQLARAKGAVEKSHFHWERKFESRFRAEPLVTIDRLNDEAVQFAARICKTETHRRHGKTRTSCYEWLLGKDVKLRVPACDIELARQIATSDPKECFVNGAGSFSFKSNRYRVPEALLGQSRVLVQFDPYHYPSVYVRSIDPNFELSYVLDPIQTDHLGFASDAAMVGEEFKRHKLTARQKVMAEAGEELAALQARGIVTRGYHLEGLTASGITTPETLIDPAFNEPARLKRRHLAMAEVCARVGYSLSPAERDVFKTWGEEVTEDQIDAACQLLRNGVTAKVISFSVGS